MKFITGTTYNCSHLRPLPDNWQELVEAGHPLATAEGRSIRNLRLMRKAPIREQFAFDYWIEEGGAGEWLSDHIHTYVDHHDRVRATLKLAPIAVKDGKPLHLGDKIELRETWVRWSPPVKLDFRYNPMHEILAGAEWRWPVEKK